MLSLQRHWALLPLGLALLAGCNSSEQDGGTDGGSQTGGQPAGSGGETSPGGSTSSGGAAAASGGSQTGGSTNSSGGAGAPTGGTGGDVASGGAATGGTGMGGSATGGTGVGGAATGGTGMGGELKTYVYVGSGDWSEQEDGLVTVYEMKRATKELAYVSEHPAGGLASFLAIDEQRGRLFVADEVDGGVISFSIDRQTGKLTELGATTSANHPVYLALTPDGASLLAANYAEGSVDVYPLGADGLALASTETRITGTSTHCVALIAGNNVLVANKDSDTLSHFHLDGGLLSLGSPETTAVTSPRHITYGPDGRAYVVSEEADLLSAYDVASEGALSLAWQEPRLAAGGVAATDTGGDIHVTPSGSFLYASNRGNSNTIVGYDLRESPPRLIGHTPSQGTTPRNFALDPQEEFLVVGNHGSQKSLATFSIADDGSLELAELMPLSISPFFVGVVQFASP